MSDKPFIPEFGPNGAVMNAPGMSDEMRQEIEQSGGLHPLKGRAAEFPRFFLTVIAGVFVIQCVLQLLHWVWPD